MAVIDFVFEGGGAKGIAFIGALKELMGVEGHRYGRLLGTSAGALMATFLAAKYTVAEMEQAICEQDKGRSVFAGFLGKPGPFDPAVIGRSTFRRFLQELRFKFIPEFVERRLDDWIVKMLAVHPRYCNLFSFIEYGGWYSANAFMAWMQRKLDEGSIDGRPRRFSHMTLRQFYEATDTELTVVAADTSDQRMLILNHRTAPSCPLVWAVRMSMSIPFIWQEVEWQNGWGTYLGRDLTGHRVVDGGLLSNFPIALFLAPDPYVMNVMGPAAGDYVVGMLLDDAIAVPFPQANSLIDYTGDLYQLPVIRRFAQLIDTMMTARDKAAIELYNEHVVRLPAGGYSMIDFDLNDVQRDAIIRAARQAMRAYVDKYPDLAAARRRAGPARSTTLLNELTNRLARRILEQ